VNDVRFALRILARNPGSTAIIVTLLALGTGASTTIFSLFDAVLLRPLPVRHPEQLMRMVQQFQKPLGTRSEFPYVFYKALRDGSKTLGPVFGERNWYEHFRMTEPEPAEEITVHGVTAEFFDALGVRPLTGRLLMADDATRKFDMPPAVLSYNFWRKRFGGDPESVHGRTLAIRGHRFLIVGVMAPGFHGISVDNSPDVRIPLQAYCVFIPNFNVDRGEFELAGRLRPGITQSQARAECLAIWFPVMKEYYEKTEKDSPETVAALLKRGMDVQSLERGTSILRDNFSDPFKLLMASVSLLLVIVGLNVAGLLLARAAARQREMAVRLAVGGTPLRLGRQLVVESGLLSAAGAAGGLIVALITIPLALHSLPPVRALDTSIVPISLDLGLNWRVFLFLLASSAITMLIFAVSPVIATLRCSIDSVLRTARSSRSFRGRQLLIAGQIALCTFLLASAGLLARSFKRLHDTPSGFAVDSIATFRCEFDTSKSPAGAIDAVLERVREIPGVISAATSSSGVMREHGIFANVVPAGQRITRADFMGCNVNRVSRDYFRAMGMRLLAGRNFIPSDVAAPKQTTPVKTIVNEAFVQRFFPGSNGIGKRFGTGVEGSIAPAESEIVGVVSDAKYRSLRDPIRPMFYSLETGLDSGFTLNVRTRVSPESIIQPVRRALASAVPALAILETGTLAQAADDTTAPERITAALASLFAGMATLLAGIGTYGLLAYAITQRRREIGIRMALGARSGQVAGLIAGQTFAIAATGIIAGLIAALLAGPAIRSLLYDVSPRDPISLTAAAIFVLFIAVVATIGPALEAIHIQPAGTLRVEG
jgi:predicted permease